MKNFALFLFLCFTLSCSERKQTDDVSTLSEQLENVETKTEIENAKKSGQPTESLGLLGKWTIPSTFGGGELTIEHHLGKYYKNEELSDGTVNISEMILREEGALKIFSVKDGSAEETWVITEKGSLEVRTKDGLIYRSEPI